MDSIFIYEAELHSFYLTSIKYLNIIKSNENDISNINNAIEKNNDLNTILENEKFMEIVPLIVQLIKIMIKVNPNINDTDNKLLYIISEFTDKGKTSLFKIRKKINEKFHFQNSTTKY